MPTSTTASRLPARSDGAYFLPISYENQCKACHPVNVDLAVPGKDKTIIVDLAGKFPTADHRVRIRTNMQIYWDQAFVAYEDEAMPVRVSTLAPVAADLHYRGFSRMARPAPNAPHHYHYDQVDTTSPWLPLPGRYTRYGEVAGETSYQGGGMPAPGTGPAYPSVPPTTDEPYYPPPTEGEARR